MGVPGSAAALLFGQSEDSSYEISRSLRFNSGDTANIVRTCGNPTASGTWTLSCWVKRNKLGGDTTLFSARSGSNAVQIYFPSTDKLRFYENGRDMYTDAVFRDTSAWYHIVVTRTTTVNSIYVNGLLSKSTTYSSSSSSDANTNGASQAFGMLYFVGSSIGHYGDMYLADPHFIDGQALAPTDFGETDEFGVWQPKKYSGSYGTNGFHLDFSDNSSASALGNDAAGSNNWSVNNLSVAAGAGNDSLRDSPSQIADQSDTGAGGEVVGNYCTLNPLDKHTNATLSNGNLDYSGASKPSGVRGTLAVSSGKWYYEFTPTASPYPSAPTQYFGFADVNVSYIVPQTGYIYLTPGFYSITTRGSYKMINGTQTATGWGDFPVGTTMGAALDLDNGTLKIYGGGNLLGTIATGLSGTFTPLVFADTVSSGDKATLNFGARPFVYTAPSGYKSLNTANLPEPTIADGSQYFEAVTYTGNSATKPISLNYSPSFVWVKKRPGGSHFLYDIVRGFNNGNAYELRSNGTNAEGVPGAANSGLTSFNSDGFTLGSDSGANANNDAFIAWSWDAGSSTVSNTDGSITSQVRANPSAGFSIVKATIGSGSVGHGLNAVPSFVITKTLGSGIWWTQGHVYSNPAATYQRLNTAIAAGTDTNAFNNTAATSTTFNFNSNYLYGSSQECISYCFAPVEGYSAMGSYVGTNSADGPFVFTGFKPAFVLLKNISSGGTNWSIHDNKRLGYNPDQDLLFPNTDDAENATSYMDFLSNGFKLRINSSFANASGSTFIYLAFAEHPFKTARAR
jgi:hypothetical protein